MGKSKDLATRVGIDDNADATAITIDSSERVGIGTVSPDYALTVEGTSHPRIRLNATDNTASGLFMHVSNGGSQTGSATVRVDGSGNYSVYNGTSSSPLTMNIDASGHVTKPNQPFCSVAYTDGDISSGQVVDFNVVTENNGSHYNSSNGRFTAPIAGHYMINVSVLTGNGAISGFSIRKNGNFVRKAEFTRTGTSYAQFGANCIINLAASDYIDVYWKNGSIYGGGGNYTMMDVYLLG